MRPRALPAFLFAALCVAGTAVGQTIFVNDTFTVGANTLLEAHTPNTGGAWSRQFGGSGITLNAAADNARNAASNDWNVYTNATTSPNAEIVVGVTVTFTNANANNYIDLFGRGSLALLNAYSCEVAANGTVTLYRWTGGGQTALATTTIAMTLNTAHSIVLSLKNASKEVWIDGVMRVSSTDNTVTGTGIVALAMNSNTAAQTIADNFFGATFAPTAVSRLDADVTRDGDRTLVEWTTSREVQSLGFRVYRDGVRATHGLVAGASFMTASAALPAGHTYRFVDSETGDHRYTIESIDTSGHSSWFGPFTPRRGTIDARVAPSPTLTDLGQTNGVRTPARMSIATNATTTPTARHRSVASGTRDLAQQWQLAAAGAMRIDVTASGLHRVTRAELVAAGLDPSVGINTFRIFADGHEVPTIVDGDSLLFYGEPLDTPSSGTRTYWLIAGAADGLRMPLSASAAATANDAASFLATAERRDKQIFFTASRDADADSFVGPVVSTDASQPTTQSLRITHIDRNTGNATLTVSLQGASDLDATIDHRVAVSVNGTSVGEVSFDGRIIATDSFTVPLSALRDGDNSVALVAKNGDADASAVISVTLAYPHTYVADDDRLLATATGGREVTISGFTSNDVTVLDVTNPAQPIRIMPSAIANGAVTFTTPAGASRTIFASSAAALLHPAAITRDTPSTLHASNGADVVIITHPSFASALAPLIALREAQGLHVLVANVNDVYDEFDYGARGANAIRAFLAHASRNWNVKPRYVLLVGDASFDERNFLGLGDFDFVPTKLVVSDLIKTASDSWLVDFDNDGAADIPIGRLPVRTLADAQREIGKIVTYETTSTPPSDRVVLISDADAALDFHAGSTTLAASVPAGYQVVDINAASSGSAAAHQEILAAFSNALVIDYLGHGSVETWSNDALLGRNDVSALAHNDLPPIVVAMTCLNGYFHDVYSEALGESLLRADGGAVAVWASSALTSPEAQLPVNQVFLSALLSTPDIRLGDAIVTAQKVASQPDIRTTFLLLGDPAMKVRKSAAQ